MKKINFAVKVGEEMIHSQYCTNDESFPMPSFSYFARVARVSEDPSTSGGIVNMKPSHSRGCPTGNAFLIGEKGYMKLYR